MRTFSLIIALFFIGHSCLPTYGTSLVPVAFAAAPPPAPAGGAVFQGGGLQQGIQAAQNIGVSQLDLRTLIVNAISVITNMLGMLAAVSIVICGILLIVSIGDETTSGKARKGILYSVIGLLVILFAKAIVTFITQLG